MKAPTKTPEKTSRRKFAKTAVTAIVAAPVLSSLSSCTQTQNTANQQASNSSNQSTQKAGTQDMDRLDAEVKTHNPPIIVDGGSMKLESPDELGADTSSMILTHKRLGPSGYKDLAIVQVVTERQYTVNVSPYFLEHGAKLKLWLQRQKNDGSFDPISATPQVVFVSGNPFEVHTDEKLNDKENSYKKHRANRYTHPGHGAGFRGFRIVKWEITNSGDTRLHGASLVDAGTEDNDYQLLLSFGH